MVGLHVITVAALRCQCSGFTIKTNADRKWGRSWQFHCRFATEPLSRPGTAQRYTPATQRTRHSGLASKNFDPGSPRQWVLLALRVACGAQRSRSPSQQPTGLGLILGKFLRLNLGGVAGVRELHATRGGFVLRPVLVWHYPVQFLISLGELSAHYFAERMVLQACRCLDWPSSYWFSLYIAERFGKAFEPVEKQIKCTDLTQRWQNVWPYPHSTNQPVQYAILRAKKLSVSFPSNGRRSWLQWSVVGYRKLDETPLQVPV